MLPSESVATAAGKLSVLQKCSAQQRDPDPGPQPSPPPAPELVDDEHDTGAPPPPPEPLVVVLVAPPPHPKATMATPRARRSDRWVAPLRSGIRSRWPSSRTLDGRSAGLPMKFLMIRSGQTIVTRSSQGRAPCRSLPPFPPAPWILP